MTGREKLIEILTSKTDDQLIKMIRDQEPLIDCSCNCPFEEICDEMMEVDKYLALDDGGSNGVSCEEVIRKCLNMEIE